MTRREEYRGGQRTVPLPKKMSLNWAILGAGNISGLFVHDLLLNNERNERVKHIVKSIGSSSKSRGEQFIQTNKITKENNCGVVPEVQLYEDLYANPDVDIIYVGTPHPFHKEQVTQGLNHGKHILCEKPFTLNADDAQELIDLAKSKGLYLLEGVWTRFFPSVVKLKKLIFDDKALGDINRLVMDFSFDAELDKVPETSRIRSNELGGGALLDIGIYNLTYTRILLDDKLGKNATGFDVKAFQTIDLKDKVDFTSSMLVKYENGKQAVLTCSNHVSSPSPYLRLDGTKGYVEMFSDNPARPKRFRVVFKDGRDTIDYDDTSGYIGFIYEANALFDDIQAGRLESGIMPHDETMLVMNIMDGIRKESGLRYAADRW